jgi:hypothetical protein
MALPSNETLRLIQWLASRDHDQLLLLTRRRGLVASQVASLTALATHLLDDRGLNQTLDALSAGALRALASLEASSVSGGLAELSELGLVDARETPAIALISPALLTGISSLALGKNPPKISGCKPWSHDALGAAATTVAAMLCKLGDVIDALARHPQPATRQGVLSVTGLKALTEVLGEGYDVAPLVALGVQACLLELTPTEVSISPTALGWRESTSEQQWQAVATAWWIGQPHWLHQVLQEWPSAKWQSELPSLVSFAYPRLDSHDALREITASASLLGVINAGCLTPWGSHLLSPENPSRLQEFLPEAAPGVYATEDFTLLAPGPLTLEHRLILDRIAHRELGGLVPRYRLTSRSVLRALHSGIPAGEILPLLQSTSQTPLPSGMVHLINDTCRLAGDIELSHTRNGTTITLKRTELRAELMADPSLGPLSLRELDERTLVTRLPVERVHDILLGARHMAMIAGEEIAYAPSPDRAPLEGTEPDPLEVAVATLVATITKAASHGVPPWLGSVLEVAIALKVPLEIEVDMPGGDSIILIMEPRSVGGGRLRGVELRNSMEKTVPISAIRTATPWSPDAA